MIVYVCHQFYGPLANSCSREIQYVSLQMPHSLSFTAFVKYNLGSPCRSTRHDRHIRTEIFNSLKAQAYSNDIHNMSFCHAEKDILGPLQRAISLRCLGKHTLRIARLI
jgi:hypothetical protein